jgi:smad nuclear-interacting protein 1
LNHAAPPPSKHHNHHDATSVVATTSATTGVRPPDPSYFEQLIPTTFDGATGANASALGEPVPEPEEKHVPSFSLSGALAEDATTGNMQNGVKLKYSEPEEARMTEKMYRLYVFKNGEQVDVYHLHRQTHFLFGRNRAVVHVPVDHPSCSSQHAVIQYRNVNNVTRPYVIDLESTNGTFLNGERLECARYYELKGTDMLTFGTSTREYVLVDAGEKS